MEKFEKTPKFGTNEENSQRQIDPPKTGFETPQTQRRHELFVRIHGLIFLN